MQQWLGYALVVCSVIAATVIATILNHVSLNHIECRLIKIQSDLAQLVPK
jgi:hypothetical protein